MLPCTAAPRIISFPNDTAALEGENVTFVCSATAEPTHTTKWLVGDVLLPNVRSKDYSIDNRPGDLTGEIVSTLTVFNATTDDVGNYTCHVSNIHGNQSATVHLEIQGNPFHHKNSQKSSKYFSMTKVIDHSSNM